MITSSPGLITDDKASRSAPEVPEVIKTSRSEWWNCSSTAFWICFAVGVLLVLAGVGVWRLGPRLWPKAAPPQTTAQATTDTAIASTETLTARIHELERQLDAANAARPSATESASANAVEALDARVQRLEIAQRRSGHAAAEAVAVGALTDAAQTSRPFAAEVVALERLLPDADLGGLRPLATTGAPTRSALAAEFPMVAARAAAAAHAPGKGANFLSRMMAWFGSMISIRRTDDITSNTPDAMIARAEERVTDGDIEGALTQLNKLPAGAQAATADWREQARRRVEIERRISRLRAQALNDLSIQSPRADPVGGDAP